MADNIYGNRFYGFRAPAWHGKGFVTLEEYMAERAFNEFMGYSVGLEPVFVGMTGMNEGKVLRTQKQAIVRYPTPDDPEFRMFGNTVDAGYQLVEPYTVCQILDASLGRPVETMGALKNGEHFFVSYRMPGFDIAGDEMKSYLLIHSPYDGKTALRVRVTTIRVVCQNTLDASARIASESFAIRHDTAIGPRLAKWTDGIWERAESKLVDTRIAYDKMARTSISGAELDALIEELLPMPKKARIVPDDEVMKGRESYKAARAAMVLKDRQILMDLFEGNGFGADSPAARGKLWGVWNAFCELMDWTGNIRPNADPDDTGSIADRLFGQALAQKQDAFDSIMARVR